MSSLSAALAGDLAGWQGLPDGLDEASLRGAVAADWAWGPGLTPRASAAFRVLRGERRDAPAAVEGWFSGDVLTTVEFPAPPGIDSAAVLAALGEPELTTSSNHFVIGSSVQEEAHPARGITVAVARPFPGEQGEVGAPRIVYVQLYAPATLQRWVTAIGAGGEELRPYPRGLGE